MSLPLNFLQKCHQNITHLLREEKPQNKIPERRTWTPGKLFYSRERSVTKAPYCGKHVEKYECRRIAEFVDIYASFTAAIEFLSTITQSTIVSFIFFFSLSLYLSKYCSFQLTQMKKVVAVALTTEGGEVVCFFPLPARQCVRQTDTQ